MRMKVVAAFILIFAWIAAASPAAAETLNLTESNRIALSEKMLELQHTELMRATRGRQKSNPQPFPLHTTYQMMLQDQEMLIQRQTECYANSLAELGKVLDEFKPELESDEGEAAAAYFRSELIGLYDLRSPIAEADTILGVSMVFENSIFGMESLPLRARMALNARRWVMKKAGKSRIPAAIESQLDFYMRKWNNAYDVFQFEEAFAALSKDYAKLFLRFAEEGMKSE
jgi:hypothetical protein